MEGKLEIIINTHTNNNNKQTNNQNLFTMNINNVFSSLGKYFSCHDTDRVFLHLDAVL